MTIDPAEHLEPHDAISERAAGFLERRRFAEWNASDEAEFAAWIAESFLNRVAYLRVEAAALRAQQLASFRPLKFGRRGIRALMQRRYVIPMLAAASVALVVAFEKPLVNYVMQAPIRTYSTDVGGRTLLTFADRTQIELNTDTVVRFRITGEERTVWLDRGEAWFRVTHNAANPFTVFVGKHRITDLGTEFVVDRSANGVEVALLNGRAALSADGTPTTTLRPGDDAVATPVTLSVTRKSPEALADALAWRRGVLVFRATRLADAVREINRYNATKIVIVDPSIADLKFSGEIRSDNFGDFLYLAQSLMKLRVDRQGADILLSPEKTKKAAQAKRSP